MLTGAGTVRSRARTEIGVRDTRVLFQGLVLVGVGVVGGRGGAGSWSCVQDGHERNPTGSHEIKAEAGTYELPI